MQVGDLCCQIDGHNSELVYLCIDQLCPHQKLCCLNCMKKQHENHVKNIMELEKFLIDVEEQSIKLHDIKLLVQGVYLEIQTVFNRIQKEIIDLEMLYKKYSDQQYLRKVQRIENIFDSDIIFLQARQTLQKFQVYVNQFDQNFFLLQKKPQPEPQELCDKLKIAVDRMKNKQYEAALFYIESCLKDDATNCEALTLQSSCLLNLNDIEGATHIAQISYALNPTNLNNLLILGRIYIKLQKYSYALQFINEGLRIDPNHKLLLLLKEQIPTPQDSNQNLKKFGETKYIIADKNAKINTATPCTTDFIDCQELIILKQIFQYLYSKKDSLSMTMVLDSLGIKHDLNDTKKTTAPKFHPFQQPISQSIEQNSQPQSSQIINISQSYPRQNNFDAQFTQN